MSDELKHEAVQDMRNLLHMALKVWFESNGVSEDVVTMPYCEFPFNETEKLLVIPDMGSGRAVLITVEGIEDLLEWAATQTGLKLDKIPHSETLPDTVAEMFLGEK